MDASKLKEILEFFLKEREEYALARKKQNPSDEEFWQGQYQAFREIQSMLNNIKL